MLTKVTKSSNIGSNGTFLVDPDISDFSDHCIIYGANGSGKTTFSSACWLFSDSINDELSEEIQRKLAKDGDKQLDLEIEYDGKKSKLGKSYHPIQVFNSEFVAQHVFDGKQTHLKQFKEGIVTAGQIKTPEIERIEKEQASLSDELDHIDDEKERIIGQSELTKKGLSEELNTKTIGIRMPAINVPAVFSDTKPSTGLRDLKEALATHYSSYEKNKEQGALAEDTALISEGFETNFADFSSNIKSLIGTELKDVASDKVKEQILQSSKVALKHSSAQQWHEDGLTLLRHRTEDKECPLCATRIENIEEIIEDYQTFFSDEQSKLEEKLTRAGGYLAQSKNELTQAKEKAGELKRIAADYKDIIGKVEVEKYETTIRRHINVINDTSDILVKKTKNVLYKPSKADNEVFEKISASVKATNELLERLEEKRESLYEKLHDAKFDQVALSRTIKELFLVKVDEEIVIDNYFSEHGYKTPKSISGGLSFYSYLDDREIEVRRLCKENERELKKLLASLKQESKLVNSYLKLLSIDKFEILMGTKDDDIEIVYKSGGSKMASDNSLSDGEKSSLAFAYFLSKIRHEIVDNTDPKVKIEDVTVIIDDPVSSLDEDRLFSTALVIRDEFSQTCKQLIVLSHNLLFLKFMSNVLKQKDIDRNDYILENSKLSVLPATMRNFHTSYFYKLTKIIEYNDGVLKHDEVKDYLPNYARTVLETFLSFKFCRLKGDSNKYESAGLPQLIRTLGGYTGSLQTHQKVNGLDHTNVQSELEKINRKLDPESHGTPQDITDFEYLSENELKSIAEKILSIIQFIDAIHMQEVKNRS